MNSTLAPSHEPPGFTTERVPAGIALWQRYRHEADLETEEELVCHYMPLVKTVVGRQAMTLPAHVSLEDLHSAGVIGLLQALRSYRPGSAASFETFARFRIRGAVLDELRRMDWVPRSVHDKARKLQEALAGLEQKTGRIPTEEEMARFLGIGVDDYQRLLEEVRPAAFVHLDSVLRPESGDSSTRHESISDDQQDLPGETVSRRELIELALERLKSLPAIQQRVLALYYSEDLRLKEIATIFGLTESRICQIHAQAILSIRSYLERYETAPQLP
jgi:RNA polymerase sigma factor for flagellar operon FliA